MKVLMLGRIGLLKHGGGDKVQIQNTARELERLGVQVDIKTGLSVDMAPYDLVHVFQLDWTAETNLYARRVKQANKPLVLSPIHHSIKEVKLFDDTYVFDLRRLSRFLFKDQHNRDTFKNVYRALFNPQKLRPTLSSVFRGLENMHKETLTLADIVLVQTKLEARDLQDTYHVEFKWRLIPNGVGRVFLENRPTQNPFSFEDYILSVGRIEPRKNQLRIVEAVASLRKSWNKDLHLVFVGSKPKLKHFEYVWRFDRLLSENPWILYVPKVPYEEMPAYYQHARVSVSASWFESTGLTSLEASFCGTSVVASGERAREYLGDLAEYCYPNDVVSIAQAIRRAYERPSPQVPEKLRQEYTWENVAKKTLEVYEQILS